MGFNCKKSLLAIAKLAAGIALSTTFTFCLVPQSLKANIMPLTQTEIDRQIATIPEWTREGQTLTRTFKFDNFVKAIDFVNQLVEPAEAAGHHPDIAISYNKVKISLTTHDAGGLTQLDFDLAQTISELTN